MGMFDWFSSWFSSNKHTLSRDQQREVERLLDRMRLEMQDSINSATTNTSRRLEELVNNHSRRLNSNIEDSKHYFTNEITRMSSELKEMKKQLDEDEKKKKKEKEGSEDKLSGEYKMRLEMMKMLLEKQTSGHSCTGPPSGYPPYSGWGQWQQPPVFPPGYQNAPYQQGYPAPDGKVPASHLPTSPSATLSSPVPPDSFGIHPNLQPSASSTDSNVKDFPKKLVLPDKRDYKKYGIEHEEKAHSSKPFNSSEQKLPPKNHSSVVLEPTKDSRRSSLGQLKFYSAKRLILPDTRLYRNYDRNNDPGTNHNERYAFGRRKSTFQSSANVDSQLDCGLILPDSRDYNKLVSASIQKKLADEKFEKMIDNFSQEFRPGSNTTNSTNKNKEKEIADGVKNFFLKDLDTLNKPKRESRTSSSNASVKEWLKNNENCASDDDSHESDTLSEVSVRTDVSKMSSVSVTSGKRVFYNKSGSYGKPFSVVGYSSQKNKSKPFEPKMNQANKYYANQRRNRKMKTEQNDTNSAEKNMNSNSTQKAKHSKHSSNQKDNASEISNASSGKLTEIHYPNQEEADRKGLDLFKPLTRELLFLGKNEGDEWTTHQPKCLNDIYDLERKYKVFRTIEIA